MQIWVFSKLIWSGVDHHFFLEIWPDSGEKPEHSHFEQPPRDVRKMSDQELIVALFKNKEKFQNCILDIRWRLE